MVDEGVWYLPFRGNLHLNSQSWTLLMPTTGQEDNLEDRWWQRFSAHQGTPSGGAQPGRPLGPRQPGLWWLPTPVILN